MSTVNNLNPFLIFNASAGSGKTFSLVQHYLVNLFKDKSYEAFNKMLGITFTNAAVLEMKSRILEQLYNFSNYEFDKMAQNIVDQLDIDKGELAKKSEIILDKILNNYGTFDIITIDSLFHRIIRGFAKELELSFSFDVEIDNKIVLNESADYLINQIGKDKQISNLLERFTYQKINDEENDWRLKEDLIGAGKLVLSENDKFYTAQLRKINLKKRDSDEKYLKNELDILKSKNEEISIKLLEKLGLEGFNADLFSYKYVFKELNSLLNKEKGLFEKFLKLNDKLNVKKPLLKASATDDLVKKFNQILPYLKSNLVEIKNNLILINIIKNILRDWVPLTLLSRVSAVIDKIQSEKNKILISTFSNRILKQLSINPNHNIIFEKLGNKYHNFFIDEFQDTSDSQWAILKSLIQDCLQNNGEKKSYGTLTLVGDSKQSIYRWRGAKPEQFVEIQKSKDLLFLKPKIEDLKTNYRSQKEIIEFNNLFYATLIDQLEHNQTKKVYNKSLIQNAKNEEGGYVQIDFLNKNEDLVSVYLNKIIEKIKISLKSGFDYNDIAILVRKNDEAREISVKFQEESIPHFVSEALLLSDSNQVQFLINLIELFLNPDVLSYKIQHLKLLYHFLNKVEDIHYFFSSNLNKSLDQIFNENNLNFNLDDLNKYSLFSCIEKACFEFPWIDLKNTFVNSFLDKILELQNSEQILSPLDFLKIWQANLSKWSVPLNDEVNGVKITTVHKAKGLEFPVVIVPFSDKLIYNGKAKKFWVNTSEFLGTDVGYVRINFTKKISEFGNYWKCIHEKIKADEETDSWNVFYVATTRAVNQLFIISSNKNENSYSYSNVLKKISQSKKSNKEGIFEWGKLENKKRLKRRKRKTATEELRYYIKKSDFKEKLFYPNSLNKNIKKESTKKGDLIHELLSHIYYMEDIQRVVDEYFLKEKIDKKEKEYFRKIFKKIHLHPMIKEYFSKSYVSMNEKSVLLPGRNTLRPDRISYNDKTCVVIDYKTGFKKEKDNLQVIEYMKYIKKILKKQTLGFIVYIHQNKLSVKQIDFSN